MANCAIVGINWGDEGKGRMVDYLTDHFDVVVRYQGGGNAGHTVVNDKGKFALHLLPSGIFREGVVNILGNGVALDCENLYNEIETLRAAGVTITPENLKVRERGSRTRSTAPPSRASRRSIPTSIKKRPCSPASCSTPSASRRIWPTCSSGRTSRSPASTVQRAIPWTS